MGSGGRSEHQEHGVAPGGGSSGASSPVPPGGAGEATEGGFPRATQRLAAAREAAAGAAESVNADAARQHAIATWPEAEVSYLEDPEAYEADYRAARERIARGEAAVPFYTEDATGGLGSVEGGRGFGVELEFDFPAGTDRAAALNAIATDMATAGLSESGRIRGYHEGRGRDLSNYTTAASGWRVEQDVTVAGEVVSPILHDTPESWANLQAACDIIRQHGGIATVRTGGHVHVGTGDYDHHVDRPATLLHNAASYEDTLMRLSTNPGSGEHRGTMWCRPQEPVDFHGQQRHDSLIDSQTGHQLAINMQGMRSGARSDHVEFRSFDGSLDPGVIQGQINLSLGMAHAATRNVRATDPPHEQPYHNRLGAHRARWGRRNLGTADWRESSRSARSLAGLVFWRRQNMAQVAAMMAGTSWQGPRR